MTSDLLTAAEHQAMRATVDLYHHLARIVGDGQARHSDMDEVVRHIHALQWMILAQAAGRAYPDQYRLLGGDATTGVPATAPDPDSLVGAVAAYRTRVGI